MSRETELVSTFVEMADTLVDGYDVVDLLHRLVFRCAQTLDAVDAGILLPRADGVLEVVASTSHRGELIGLLQLDSEQGPCVEAYRTGRLVTVENLADMGSRWPEFVSQAGTAGYQRMHAIPLRLRDETIGSLNLFGDTPGALDPNDAIVAQGLADIATIGILHERAMRDSGIAQQQLQYALDSRVLIEQAKGVLAQTDGLDMDEAFQRLRDRARSSRRKMTDVARETIDAARTASVASRRP